ncbi:hypothetical protein Daus18300_013637 [Diaporthe australafricana]|uniref:Ankyrin repeat protein n=1 Tax=Diaporthe australafricana TaxID=127596 RepID=A0ABR3VYD3_9PEZI
MSYAGGRFRWLEFTPTLGLRQNCTTRCEWNAKLRLALTWLNIPLAVTASFGFSRRNGQYDLRPALSIQHVVRNTSPGFEALFLCRWSHISVEEGKRRLRDLYRSDGNFKHHVNPAGQSYLRKLVSSNWPVQQDQFELLDFFVTEIGVDFSAEDPRLLIDCSKWIGEGWHMELLATILKHGFEPSAINPPAADMWPSPCSPDWRSEPDTPDPFFVDYFALILGYEPGFAGVTALQELILTDKAHPKLDLGLPNQAELFSTVNFLGQSSLHLAVGNIRIVRKLVELGHDLN